MSDFIMDKRLRLSIELALTADDADIQRRSQQEEDARQFGMTGAEVDMARRGASFDALTSIALALAAASRSGEGAVAGARERALKAGISDEVCRMIEAYAAEPFPPNR